MRNSKLIGTSRFSTFASAIAAHTSYAFSYIGSCGCISLEYVGFKSALNRSYGSWVSHSESSSSLLEAKTCRGKKPSSWVLVHTMEMSILRVAFLHFLVNGLILISKYIVPNVESK